MTTIEVAPRNVKFEASALANDDARHHEIIGWYDEASSAARLSFA